MIDNKLKEIATHLNIRFPVAEFSKNLGMSSGVVSQYVSDRRKVSKGFIEKLEEFYNISYDNFFAQQYKVDDSAFKPKYEYEVITFDNFDAGHQQRYLNERSQQDWELVSVVHFTDTDGTPCFRFYFKRKIK